MFSANGNEWLVDAHGCAPQVLRSRNRLEALLAEIVSAAGLHAVAPAQWHTFGGEAGVTGCVMLSESHLACHTYPEAGYAAFSLYCCRAGGIPWNWATRLKEVLGAADVVVRVVPRGPDRRFENVRADIQWPVAERRQSSTQVKQ